MSRIRSIIPLAVTLTLAYFLTSPGFAQPPVSTTPPQVYNEFIAPLITSSEAALKLSQELKPNSSHGGAVILNEVIHHVDEAGRRVIAIHSIYRADSDAGAESLTSDTQSFRSASQKIHIALAQTISPDGTRTPVRPNATLIQSPQRSADQSLYTDAQELLIIYPKIKPGTLTESIVVIEEDAMRVPGEFMTSTSWVSGWPEARRRLIIDLPENLGNRVRFSALGSGTPEPQRTSPTPGRTRFELSSDRAPSYIYEIGRPPVSQSGPTTWITTFADWNAFADWYRPLIENRATLKPELANLVEQWTADAKTEDEIIAKLFSRAANDIRYTGLEFGIAGLQPYDCNEVWENQYGDCKDKANLLRAMLAHKGITSFLTLLNTEHSGRIEKRSPDYRQFDHAILTIERADGSLLFCDPTIKLATPGDLTPQDADREVLMIREDRAEFTRTPAVTAGQLDYHFDLELSKTQEIAGWLTLTAHGNHATSYAAFIAHKAPQALGGALNEIVADFFPSAEVVDVEPQSLENWNGTEYKLRAYFVAPAISKTAISLTLPHSEALFPNLGDSKTRLSNYFGVAEHISVNANFRVPATAGSAQLPPPLNVDSAAIHAETSWQFDSEANRYSGKLNLIVKKSLLTPQEFQIAFGTIASLRAWLNKPLTFDPTQLPALVADAPPVAIDNFPMMPTPEGQMNLLEQRFPVDGNLNQRRAALTKILQFFPNDAKTEYNVEANLAEIDWHDNNPTAAIDRLLKLLNSSASDAVGDEEIAWAEYILAFCYRDSNKPEKAKLHFKEIAENSEVSDFRRGWAGYQRLIILKAEDNPDYQQLAEETNSILDFATEARPYVVALHATFMARTSKFNDLEQRLNSLIAENPQDLPAIIQLLASAAKELPSDLSIQLSELIRNLPVEPDSTAAALLATETKALDEFQTAASSYSIIQDQLNTFITQHQPDSWNDLLSPVEAKTLDDLEGTAEPEIYIRNAVQYLTTTPPSERFPYFLWRLAAYTEFYERSGISITKKPLLPFLLDLCDQIPKNNDYYLEGRLLRARDLGTKEQLTQESAVLEELINSGLLNSDSFIIGANIRLGNSLERQEKFSAARDRYLSLKSYVTDFPAPCDALLRAALISLEQGDRAAATETLTLISNIKPEILEAIPTGEQIKSITTLPDPIAYWDASANWWNSWQTLYKKILPDQEMKPVRVPAIGDFSVLGSALRSAVRSKDHPAFYADLDLLLRGLRWSPDFLNDCGSSLIFLATELSPEFENDLRNLVINICENYPNPSKENLRRAQLYHSLALIDSNRPTEALPIAEQFFTADPVLDPLHYSMIRIRAIAAVRTPGADLETPTKALEDVLATNLNNENRPQNVLQLSSLYHQLNRPADEEALLARELDHPAIKNNDQARSTIDVRHRALARSGSGAKKFTTAIDSWLEKHSPEWLKSCQPFNLDDPRIGDRIETALDEATSRFSIEQAIKLHLLAARSEKLALEVRESAFTTVIRELLSDAASYKQARTMLLDVLDHDDFPNNFKQATLFSGLDDALAHFRQEDIAFFLTHPALDRSNDRLSELIDLYTQLAATNFDSATSIEKAIDTFTSDTVSNEELSVFMPCYARILSLGDLATAESIYKKSDLWKLAPDVRTTNNSIKLGLLKILKYARKTIPINNALHAALSPMLDLQEVSEPAWLSQRRIIRETSDLSISEARAMHLFQVKSKSFDQTDPSFWFDLADSIQSPDTVPIACRLLEVYLKETDDDSLRSRAAFIAPGILDTDEPSVRESLTAIFAPYRNQENFPLTRDAIRLYEIRSDKLRLGIPIDLEDAFANLTHPSANNIYIRAKLTQLIQQEDKPSLTQYLQRLSADELLNPNYLHLTIPALDLAGLNDEAELARQTAIERIPALIAEGWRIPRSGALNDAYQFAILANDPSLIPSIAFNDLRSSQKLKNERSLSSLSMLHYQLHKDWPQLETSADAAIVAFPTFYSFYLEKARALIKQQKHAEAIEPLKIFLRYCADESEFTQAKRWLNESEN